MRIEEDVKLDFKDVLIRPKRSTLSSRKEVDISREYQFRWSGQRYKGIPIIAANMDGVGTTEMARAFGWMGSGMTVALHKHYDIDTLLDFFKKKERKNAWYSIGVSDTDEDKLKAFLKKAPKGTLTKLCIDVANGYSQPFRSEEHTSELQSH